MLINSAGKIVFLSWFDDLWFLLSMSMITQKLHSCHEIFVVKQYALWQVRKRHVSGCRNFFCIFAFSLHICNMWNSAILLFFTCQHYNATDFSDEPYFGILYQFYILKYFWSTCWDFVLLYVEYRNFQFINLKKIVRP